LGHLGQFYVHPLDPWQPFHRRPRFVHDLILDGNVHEGQDNGESHLLVVYLYVPDHAQFHQTTPRLGMFYLSQRLMYLLFVNQFLLLSHTLEVGS